MYIAVLSAILCFGIMLFVCLLIIMQDTEMGFANWFCHRVGTIRIKQKQIGNQHFNILTIKVVYGIERFPSFQRQVTKFQEVVENMTDKIIYYKLADYYDQNFWIQEHINDFCVNLKCINRYLKNTKRIEPYNIEDLNDRILTRAVSEIEQNNQAIINALETINNDISYYIKDHDLKLLPHPRT